MKITQSPRGDFFIASHNGLTVFDRDRAQAIARLTVLIWPMPPPPHFDEFVSFVRTRPAIHRSNTQ